MPSSSSIGLSECEWWCRRRLNLYSWALFSHQNAPFDFYNNLYALFLIGKMKNKKKMIQLWCLMFFLRLWGKIQTYNGLNLEYQEKENEKKKRINFKALTFQFVLCWRLNKPIKCVDTWKSILEQQQQLFHFFKDLWVNDMYRSLNNICASETIHDIYTNLNK